MRWMRAPLWRGNALSLSRWLVKYMTAFLASVSVRVFKFEFHLPSNLVACFSDVICYYTTLTTEKYHIFGKRPN